MSTHRKKSSPGPKGEQKLRIIGGRWRGRLLPFPDIDGLRPTGSRIRETLFNWLQPTLPGSHCLDLFAGSGALGFEALSRGASHVTLIELNATASKQLLTHINTLQCPEAQVIKDSALRCLQAPPVRAFDIVFIDPPFALDLWDEVITGLQQHPWLKPGALIYLEMPRGKELVLPANWQLHRQKEAGQVRYCLYRHETNTMTTG